MKADGEQGQGLTETLQLRLSTKHKKAFQKAAQRKGLSVSGWLRQLGLEAIEQANKASRK